MRSTRRTSNDVTTLLLVTLLSALIDAPIGATHEQLCTEDDYTNDLPIFIEKRTICNYETNPVSVYQIKIIPDTDDKTKFCLKGQFFTSISYFLFPVTPN